MTDERTRAEQLLDQLLAEHDPHGDKKGVSRSTLRPRSCPGVVSRRAPGDSAPSAASRRSSSSASVRSERPTRQVQHSGWEWGRTYSSCTALGSSSSAGCVRCSPLRRSGVRCSPNPEPAPDMAALSARAIRDGDGVGHQRPEGVDHARPHRQVGDVICRTDVDPEASRDVLLHCRHDRSGVEVRPLRQITGEAGSTRSISPMPAVRIPIASARSVMGGGSR